MKRLILLALILLVLPSGFALLTDDLVSYYTFDDADIIFTDSQTDKHGTNNADAVSDPVTGITGVLNEAYNFTGTSAYMRLGQGNLDITGDMSISAWVRIGNPATQAIISSKYNGTAATMQWVFQVVSNTIFFSRYDGTAQRDASKSISASGNWRHVVAVETGTQLVVYIDGVRGGTNGTMTGTAPSITIQDAALGARKINTTIDVYFEGEMDEVGFWSRGLTDVEVAELYNAGMGVSYPFSDANLSVTLLNPSDGLHTNSGGQINFTYNLSTVSLTNCSLYEDGVVVSSSSGLSSGVNNFLYTPNPLGNTERTWFVGCRNSQTAVNATNRTLGVDLISPEWIFNAANFFDTAGNTTINVHDQSSITFNLSADDEFMFKYSVVIRNSSGSVYFNQTAGVTHPNVGLVNVTNTTTITSWAPGRYNVSLYAADFRNTTNTLNSVSNTYYFNISWTPDQAHNLTVTDQGIDFVNLSWVITTGTNHTLLYRDSTNIWNGSTLNYSDTGLASATAYVYTIYAANGTSINLSVTTANQETGTTIFNSSTGINIYDEATNTILNGTNGTIVFISGVQNTTITSNTGFFSLSNLNPATYTLRHTAVGYGVRDQFLTISNDTVNTITLYLLADADSTLMPVRVVDLGKNPVQGAVIHWKRWFDNHSAYTVVEMTTSGEGGYSNLYFQPYDAWYEASIYYNGELKKTTSPRRFLVSEATDGLEFAIDVGDDVFESFIPTRSFYSDISLTYDNVTRTYSYTYADTTGILDTACITLWEVNPLNETYLNQTCSSSASSTLVVGHRVTSKTIHIRIEIDTNTANSWYPLDFFDPRWTFTQTTEIKNMFLFATIIFIGTLSLISGASPVIPIAVSVIGLFVGWIAFGLSISATSIMMILALAFGLIGLMAWRVGR